MSLHLESFSIGPMDNNLYLLRDDVSRALVVVDPSLSSDIALDRVRQLQGEGYTLTAIWNTHGHFDHVYENARWKQEFKVPLLAHPADNFFLEHLKDQAIWFGFEPPQVVLPDAPIIVGEGSLSVGSFAPKVLHLPGHSPGSVAFYFVQHNWCIVGDVLFSGSVGRTDLPGCSAAELAASLRQVWLLPPQTQIFPGHGPATILEQEQNSNAVAKQLMRQYPA